MFIEILNDLNFYEEDGVIFVMVLIEYLDKEMCDMIFVIGMVDGMEVLFVCLEC